MAEYDIPDHHKAVIFSNPGTTETEVIKVRTPEPADGEVLVRLRYSGVCHSDYAGAMDVWKFLPEPTPKGQIGGHEGIGIVVKLGTNVTSKKIGDRVGVTYVTSSCLTCEACLDGDEFECPKKKVSGYITPGTFQQYMCVDSRYVSPIPDGIDDAHAAPLLCAGVTVYNALLKSDVKAGQWVVISGAGGGLGHLAIQYAKGMGHLVLAVDHGAKEQFCRSLGVDAFVDFTKFDNAAITKKIRVLTGGGAHGVLVNSSSRIAYDQAIEFLRYRGTMVCVGVPEGDAYPIAKATPPMLGLYQLTIKGTSTGNRRDIVHCMKPAVRGVVKPHIRIVPMEELSQIFRSMYEGNLQGRAVLDLWG